MSGAPGRKTHDTEPGKVVTMPERAAVPDERQDVEQALASMDEWRPLLGDEYCDAFQRMVDAAQRRSALTNAERHLILMAVNAAVHLGDREGVRRHMLAALQAGASDEQVMAALKQGLGMHTVTQCVPILLDELERVGRPIPIPTDDELTEAERTFQRHYTARRGFWYAGWNRMLRLDSDFLAAHHDMSAASYPSLSPQMKELVNIAVNAATTHLYLSGTRVHMRRALELGVPADAILEVLEIVVLVGFHSIRVGMPIYEECKKVMQGSQREREGQDD